MKKMDDGRSFVVFYTNNAPSNIPQSYAPCMLALLQFATHASAENLRVSNLPRPAPGMVE